MTRMKIIRRRPRIAGKGRVLFDKFGRTIAIRNAPNIRRLKKQRRR